MPSIIIIPLWSIFCKITSLHAPQGVSLFNSLLFSLVSIASETLTARAINLLYPALIPLNIAILSAHTLEKTVGSTLVPEKTLVFLFWSIPTTTAPTGK